jgi:hypothetical protein
MHLVTEQVGEAGNQSGRLFQGGQSRQMKSPAWGRGADQLGNWLEG